MSSSNSTRRSPRVYRNRRLYIIWAWLRSLSYCGFASLRSLPYVNSTIQPEEDIAKSKHCLHRVNSLIQQLMDQYIYLSTVTNICLSNLLHLATTCISQSIFRRRSISDIKYSSDIDTMCNLLFSSTKLDYQRYVDKVGVLEATSLVLHKVYLLLVTTCKQAHWARQAPLLAEPALHKNKKNSTSTPSSTHRRAKA